MGHLTRDVVPGVRLGVLGYRGQQQGASGPFQLNAQYVHRQDDRPTFLIGEPRVLTDGGFAELVLRPAGADPFRER